MRRFETQGLGSEGGEAGTKGINEDYVVSMVNVIRGLFR